MDKLQMEHPAPLRKTGLTTHFFGFSPTIDFSDRSGAVQYDALHRSLWDHKSAPPHDRLPAEASWLHPGWEHHSQSSGIDVSLKSGVDDAAAAALCRSWDSWDDSAVLQHKRRAADEKRQQQHVGVPILGTQDCGSLLSDDRSAAGGKTGFPPTAAVIGSRFIPLACKLDAAATEGRDVGFATLSGRVGFNDEEETYTSGNKPVPAGGFQVKVEMDEYPKTGKVDAAKGSLLANGENGRSHQSLVEMGGRGKEHRMDVLMPKRESEQEGGTVGTMGDATIGLKLGKRTYFEDGAAGGGGSGSRAASSSPNSTGNNNNSNNNTVITSTSSNKKQKLPRCQAEGCKSDLSSAKEYHRRHKVCPMHSKASKVKVGISEQRFCQQCSRFHVLSEFDEGKRSCRRRLAGHNERRRKPQPVAMSLLSSASFPYQSGDKHLLNSSLLEHPCFLQQQHHHQRPPFSTSSLDHAALACQLRFPAADSQVLKFLRIPKEEPASTFPSLELQHFMQGSGTLVSGHGLALSNPPGAMHLGSEALSLASQPPSGISVSGRALSLLSSSLVSQDNPISMSLGVSPHPSLSIEQLLAENQAGSSHQIVPSSSAGQPCFTPQSITNSNGSVTGSPDTMDKEPREPPAISDFDGRSMFIMLRDNNFQGLHGGDSQHGRPILDLMQISSPQSQGSRPASLQQPIDVQYTELEGLRSYESMFGSQNIM